MRIKSADDIFKHWAKGHSPELYLQDEKDTEPCHKTLKISQCKHTWGIENRKTNSFDEVCAWCVCVCVCVHSCEWTRDSRP